MEAIIFCGIQATGKTTFFKDRFFKTHVRISLDQLNTRNKEEQFMDVCLHTQQPFVVDNTNPTRAERSRYISMAKRYKFKVTGYYFRSAIADAILRNSHRSGKELIPEVGIRGTLKKLELPSLEEGFDELYYVDIIDGNFVTQPWNDKV